MATKFKQTTEETHEISGGDQPVNVSYQGPDDREVRMRVGAPAIVPVRSREPNAPSREDGGEMARPPSLAEFFAVSNWMQSIQNIQQQQLTLLHEINNRLGPPSGTVTTYVSASPVERATWWALWGILMLILGGALVVVLLLILTQNPTLLRPP